MLAVEGLEPVFTYVQAQWCEHLNIEIPLELLGLNAFAGRMYARQMPPIFTALWLADYPDPDNFLRAAFQTHAYECQNEEYWELIEEARRLLDKDQRMKLYARAERILVEAASLVPLVYFRMNHLVKPWVRYPVATGGYGFWQDVTIEPH
jgi:ABC-type oligopeptide transport system substrate-binding subunit